METSLQHLELKQYCITLLEWQKCSCQPHEGALSVPSIGTGSHKHSLLNATKDSVRCHFWSINKTKKGVNWASNELQNSWSPATSNQEELPYQISCTWKDVVTLAPSFLGRLKHRRAFAQSCEGHALLLPAVQRPNAAQIGDALA